MQKLRINIMFLAGLLLGLGCGGLKLDSTKNCLNPESKNCFKADITQPKFVSATPAPNSLRATLATVSLVFSESLRNGEDKTAYKLNDGHNGSGLTIAGVKHIPPFTYEISINGSILTSTPITLDFSALRDYAGNEFDGTKIIEYTGNVSSGITGSANHNGLGIGGYTDVTVTFEHSYATDPQNMWQVSVTNGSVFCGAGTIIQPFVDGVYLTSGVSQSSIAIGYANFGGAANIGAGNTLTYKIVVCVKNKNNPNALSVFSWQILRDDSAPTTSTASPPNGNYGGTPSMTVTCNDNAETIAVTSLSQTGSAPPMPADPTFNVTTGAVTNGTAYAGAFTIPNPTNPTFTNYKWLCMDVAGHVFGSVQSRAYGVDVNIPSVTIDTNAAGYHSAVSNAGGSTYGTTNISFTTDMVGTAFQIVRGGTNCDTGTVIAAGTVPSAPVPLGFASFPVNATAHDMRVCVRNAGNTLWGSDHKFIARDDAVPGFATGLVALTNSGNGTITLGWNLASDSPAGVEAYEVCRSETQSPAAGSCQANFVKIGEVAHPATSYQDTGTSTSTTYYYMVRARDYAGNRDGNNVEKKSRISISVIVAGYSSAVPDFRVTEGASTLIFTSNTTQTFSNVYSAGQTYSIQVNSQPGGQYCAFIQNQFGTINADLTLNVNCVNGYAVAGAINVNPPVKLGYRLYQGKNAAVAGNSGVTGSNNATGAAATFNFPEFLTHLNGSLYVSDTNNFLIRRVVTASNAVTTLAGSGAGAVGTAADNGPCLTAKLGSPMGVATDGTNLYVAEYDRGRIRKLADISGTCQATIFAGTGTNGFADGPATTAQFNGPRQIVTNQDYIFVADLGNHRIRRIALATGVVDTLAGNGTPADSPGTGTGASIQGPDAVTLIGNVLYASTASHRIMAIDITTGVTTIVAGDGTASHADALGTAARFNGIISMTTDGSDIYAVEFYSHIIRRIEVSKGYRVTTLAGGAALVGDVAAPSIGPIARYNTPHGIVTDGRILYVTNHSAQTLRKISDNGMVGYWPLKDSARDYASDITTPSNATPVGTPALALGRFNEASGSYRFNGTTDYFNSTARITVGSACNVSIAAWYKPNSLAAFQGIAYNGNSSSSGFGLVYTPANGIQVLLGGVGSVPSSGGYRPTVGQWMHLTARCVGGVWAVFVNGNKVSEAPLTASGTAPAGFTIGRDSNTAYLDGFVADVRVFNRALTEGDINELAQDATSGLVGASFNNRATGLLSHYEFTGVGPNVQPSGPIGGVLTGTGSSVTGKDGNANGATSSIGITNHIGQTTGLPSGNAPRSLCAYVLPTEYPTGGNYAYLASYGDITSFAAFAIGLRDAGGGVMQIVNAFSSGADNLVNFRVPLNTWGHLCATFDGSLSRLYWNGSEMGTQPATLATTLTSFAINAWPDNTQRLKSQTDDVRIYNNALTAVQIRQLATQVPAGLVARYDFSGDRNDISGFGQDLNNNGATLGTDRFGVASAAASFAASAYFDGPMTALPLGASPRTMCAWTNPNNLLNGVFSEVSMYGINAGSQGWGFGMDASGGLPNGRIFILDTAGDLVSAQPHGLNIWRHICITYNGTAEQLYVDAYSVAGKGVSLNTTSGQIFIGKGLFAGDYFNGSIDDVRVYNRVLGTNEMQALQQQSNKRIFVTQTAYTGAMGGVSGVDARCTSDANKPTTGTYKAMVVSDAVRRACSTSYCTGSVTENIDWVLRSNITYTRTDGTTPIFTSNFATVFNFAGGNFVNPIDTVSQDVWTGINFGVGGQWTIDGGPGHCNNWTGNGTNGVYGNSNAIAQTTAPLGVIYQGYETGTCNIARRLYCVEQ